MNCEAIEQKLADYASRRLAAEEAQSVASHLDGCRSCREFLAQIESLYEVEEPAEVAAMHAAARDSAVPSFESPAAGRGALLRVAALLLLAVSIGVLAFAFRPHGQPTGPDHAARPAVVLPLLPLEVELPSFPIAYADGAWISSREEALSLSSFTGRPIFEAYEHPHCPRCIFVEKELERVQSIPDLRGFICYKQPIESDAPDWMQQADLKLPYYYMLPVIRVVDGECTTAPRWEISSLDEMARLAREWREECQERAADVRMGLGRAQYEETAALLTTVPLLLAERRLGAALVILDRVIALDREFRTAFVDCARTLRAKVVEGIDRQIDEIARLHRRTGEERRQAVDLARRFQAELGALPEAERLAPFLE